MAFRPRKAAGELVAFDGPLGVGVLDEDSGRDGVLYIPETAERGAPVIMFLHGATGTGRRELRAVLAAADRYGVVVVAPDSRGITWDVVMGGFAPGSFGPDVVFFDRALDAVADRCDVDMERPAIGGVSDGASYALSIAVTNGDVFDTVIAFSPGFVIPGPLHGKPRMFISHGTTDPILPIDRCSRLFVPGLRAEGYDVTYEEFDGGHTVPPPVSDKAFAWWLESR